MGSGAMRPHGLGTSVRAAFFFEHLGGRAWGVFLFIRFILRDSTRIVQDMSGAVVMIVTGLWLLKG